MRPPALDANDLSIGSQGADEIIPFGNQFLDSKLCIIYISISNTIYTINLLFIIIYKLYI